MHVLQSGNLETALLTYDRALELDRRNVDAHVARGAAFANQRDFARAIADFEAALGLSAHPVHLVTFTDGMNYAPCYVLMG